MRKKRRERKKIDFENHEKLFIQIDHDILFILKKKKKNHSQSTCDERKKERDTQTHLNNNNKKKERKGEKKIFIAGKIKAMQLRREKTMKHAMLREWKGWKSWKT